MSARFGIKGFIPVSFLDWPGNVCSVIFLGGCNFRCHACHNPDLVLKHPAMPDLSIDRVLGYLDKRKGWIDGITVTGGEPTIRPSLPDLLRIFKGRGTRVKLDTNGSNPEMLERLVAEGLVDGVSMDVKAPLTDEEYSRVAGVSTDVEAIRRSIEILRCSAIETVFRTTVIPRLVEEPELARIRRALGSVERYIIQGFRNGNTLNEAYSTSEEFSLTRLEEMKRLFEVPVARGPVAGRTYAAAG